MDLLGIAASIGANSSEIIRLPPSRWVRTSAKLSLKRLLPEVRFVRNYWITSHPDTHETRRV